MNKSNLYDKKILIFVQHKILSEMAAKRMGDKYLQVLCLNKHYLYTGLIKNSYNSTTTN